MSRVTITLHVRETAPRARPFDLTRVPVLGRFLRWRHARTAIQIPMLALSLALLYDGFFGPQLAPKNVAGVLPWVHWRGFVILALLVVGNLFCLGCPFMLPRRLAKRLLPANRAWPAWLRGKWVAIGLLAAFFWAYEAFDLWASPLLTAWVVVAYFVAAFVIDGFFGGAAFCKHVCPIGQFHFVNSLASPFEVAVREPSTCADCRTKDCISGRRGPDGQLIQQGCELGLFQQRKVGNIDCTFCLDCVHACPYDNVGVLGRNPLHDITRDPNRSGIGRLSRRTDIAALALVLVFGAFINAFGMVSPVYTLEQWLADRLGTTSEYPVLLAIFGLGLILAPILLVGGAAWTGKRLARDQRPVVEVAARFSYGLIPLGFGMWIAHYGYHFLTGALTIVPLAQRFVADLGVFWLGSPRWDLASLVTASWLDWFETIFLALGLFGSLIAMLRIAEDGQRRPYLARRAFLPWAILCLVLFAIGLWLMAQPMEMRGVTLGG